MQVRDYGTQNQTQVAYDESFLGPKGGCVVNEISRSPVPEYQAGRCKFLQTCTDPHLGCYLASYRHASSYLTLHLEVGLLDRSKSPLLGTPMLKRCCLQPSKSAMQPCRPWSTNINQVAPGISELKSLCKRQMFHIEARAILRASDLLGLLANTLDLSNLLQNACCIKLTLLST